MITDYEPGCGLLLAHCCKELWSKCDRREQLPYFANHRGVFFYTEELIKKLIRRVSMHKNRETHEYRVVMFYLAEKALLHNNIRVLREIANCGLLAGNIEAEAVQDEGRFRTYLRAIKHTPIDFDKLMYEAILSGKDAIRVVSRKAKISPAVMRRLVSEAKWDKIKMLQQNGFTKAKNWWKIAVEPADPGLIRLLVKMDCFPSRKMIKVINDYPSASLAIYLIIVGGFV